MNGNEVHHKGLERRANISSIRDEVITGISLWAVFELVWSGEWITGQAVRNLSRDRFK